MNSRTARCLAGLIVLLASSAALSQDPVLKTRPREDPEEKLNAKHRVTLNVQVTDAAGNAVSDLRAEEFSLYDNHSTRRIVAFHPIDGEALADATEILIVLDAVNTPAEALVDEKNAIFKYLAENRKPLMSPTAFALWFNGHLSATPATKDRNAIGRAFVKLTKNIHSNACGTEQNAIPQKAAASKSIDPANCRAVHFKNSVGVLDGIAQQQLVTGGRTLLIWMGSGWPVLSDADLSRLTAKQRDAYAQEFVRVMHDLRAAQLTVYSIAAGVSKPLDINSGGEDSDTARMQTAATVPRIAVDEFARRTGGRAINSSTDIASDLRACVRDASWYYSLEFNAPPAQNGTGEIRSLEIKIDRPGLEVRTMTSYYSEPQ